MSIQVKEFIHVPGENDAEYIRLLNEQIERQKKLLNKAMAKLRETEPKTGTWVRSHTGTIGEGFYCSRCGKPGYKTDFCPNCGADMGGKKSDD